MKKILVIALTLISIGTSGQKFDLGEVSIEELKEKQHPKDTSAVAAVLYEKGKTYYEFSSNKGFLLVTEVETRIKIYKKKGYDWANIQLSLYKDGSTREEVYFSNTCSYNLVNGKIEKIKLKSEGIFNEEVNKYNNLVKITMPNIKEGTVIEYKYKRVSPFFNLIKDWNFQSTIPVNYSEYTTIIPEYYAYKTEFKGFLQPKVIRERKEASILFNNKSRDQMGADISTSYNQNEVKYFEDKTNYVLKRYPSIKRRRLCE